jgi:UDP-N-acetylglucosamine--N-acetylmuramyl-(pentapeptide) pyrophosphoryl-undecaprenol N-acetylglucosamine transferase
LSSLFPSKNILIYDILESSNCKTSYGNVERSIADTHFTTGPLHIFEKKMNRSLLDLVNKCDKVIIPDFGSNRTNLLYVGPIVREVTLDRKELRNELGLSRKTILVCTGGTNAGRYLIQKSLEAAGEQS